MGWKSRRLGKEQALCRAGLLLSNEEGAVSSVASSAGLDLGKSDLSVWSSILTMDGASGETTINRQGTAAEQNVVDGPKEAVADAPWREMLALGSDGRARWKLQNLQQGTRLVADFTLEFRQLARQIRDWPEPVLIHFHKEALDPEITQWGTMAATPQRWRDGIGER
uniref:Uncharacterized protein n=1 Tax=Sphaerodactylus townsendi TaxID=933632 RepID=A0ACB8F0R6_9SAUR